MPVLGDTHQQYCVPGSHCILLHFFLFPFEQAGIGSFISNLNFFLRLELRWPDCTASGRHGPWFIRKRSFQSERSEKDPKYFRQSNVKRQDPPNSEQQKFQNLTNSPNSEQTEQLEPSEQRKGPYTSFCPNSPNTYCSDFGEPWSYVSFDPYQKLFWAQPV